MAGSPVAPLADPSVRRVAYVRARVGLGDLLCTVPALRALRAARPDVRLTFVTWPETAPVVGRFRAYVDELLPFPGYPGIPERTPRPDLFDAFLAAAAARRFDLALQAYGDRPAANEVTALVPARRTGGFAARGFTGSGALHLPYPDRVHEIHRHLRLVEHLGVPPGADDTPEFPVRVADLTAYAALGRAHGLREGRYAVLHPGATCASRRWPPERFAAVADALAERAGLRIVVTGVRGEEAVTAALARHARTPVVDLTGRTTLGAFACLLRGAALLVANDTGAAHLAAATGTPSVTVFLSGDPVRWAHRGRRHRALSAGVACSPCPHLTCPIDFRCAHALAPGTVVAAALALLG
ncbi:glycosyltransferase family 9 protein [Streptomyces coeruleoprunus]|uniref:Glycosyltransferase family 9 protein n=1 Tax=Streptomyces coeruleoprunus TaxID=285563 RepID=A0ABV9XD38_9ACTN